MEVSVPALLLSERYADSVSLDDDDFEEDLDDDFEDDYDEDDFEDDEWDEE